MNDRQRTARARLVLLLVVGAIFLNEGMNFARRPEPVVRPDTESYLIVARRGLGDSLWYRGLNRPFTMPLALKAVGCNLVDPEEPSLRQSLDS
jgi:hypothetical protein